MDKPKKIYYTMGEVAEIFDVNCSLIRFWEKKFDILKPHKNNKGNRLFTPEDLENLKLIYHLVKENGMTLAGAQKRLKENREGIERNIEIVEKLQRMRAMLMEVKQELKIEDGTTQYISSEPLDTVNVIPAAMTAAITATTTTATATVTTAAIADSDTAAVGCQSNNVTMSSMACENMSIDTSTCTEVAIKSPLESATEVTKTAPLLMAIEQTLF